MDQTTPNIERIPEWERFRWLRHGFSTRAGGVSTVYGGMDLNLGFTREDDDEAVRENRRRFVRALTGAGPQAELISVRQVHGAVTHVVKPDHGETVPEFGRAHVEADGLMTGLPVILLGIQTADCVPVLVADVRRRVVAAFHAGWRGSVAGVVMRGIAQMRTEFGSMPDDLIGAIGPSVRICCYRVGDEVRNAFSSKVSYADALFSAREDGLYLDLAEANRRQMLDAGLSPQNVTVLPECTGCATHNGGRKYFSHRLEHGSTGRMMAAIGVAG